MAKVKAVRAGGAPSSAPAKPETGNFNVYYQAYFGAAETCCAANVTKDRAEEYVKQMQSAQPGQYSIEEGGNK
jgi:hypothetical protein